MTRLILLFLLLSSSVWADDWTQHLSPRMRKAFQPLAHPDWSPRREVELSEQERRDLKALFPQFESDARRGLKSPVESVPGARVVPPPAPIPAPGKTDKPTP